MRGNENGPCLDVTVRGVWTVYHFCLEENWYKLGPSYSKHC